MLWTLQLTTPTAFHGTAFPTLGAGNVLIGGSHFPVQFSTEDEAIQLANNSEYGLAAYYYTKVGT